MDLTAVLDWLTGVDGGAFLVIAWAVSWGLEGAAFWHALGRVTRALLILGAALALGLATRSLQLRPDLVAALDPYFRPALSIVLAWLATQTAHRLNPLRENDAADKG